MKQVPADAKQLPAPLIHAFLPTEVGRQYAWTEVVGTPLEDVQHEPGSGEGEAVWRVHFQCPRCEEEHSLNSVTPHGDHPVRCGCNRGLVFLVKW